MLTALKNWLRKPRPETPGSAELREGRSGPDAPNVNMAAFERAAITSLVGNRYLSQALEAYVYTAIGSDVDPALVPEGALERMKRHPPVYLAERVVTGVIRRMDVYTVTHKDPKIVKETEEWLWPILPRLLSAFARAYAYGSRGVVLNWGFEDLRLDVPSKEGTDTRLKTIKSHAHYVSAHSIRRSDFEHEATNDELDHITYAGERYDSDRAWVLRWDPEDEDDWWGQGARRRAWVDYCADVILGQLEAVYCERSVDNPRVAFAPDDTVTTDQGEEPVAHYVNRLLMTLRGSGAVTFPSDVDASGNELYRLQLLDVPDREKVWETAITRRERRIFMAYLALLGDGAAAAAKTLDGLLKEIVQDLASWVAEVLTEIVEKVHLANYDPKKVKPPEVEPADVGKAKAKQLLVEILRVVGGEKVGRWVDVARTLDRLGISVVDTPEKEDKPPAPPGRPRDMIGDREERREDARTEEGEEDTGAPGPARDEQQEDA